jgi:peptide-methionine (S)-S-oxide reductase
MRARNYLILAAAIFGGALLSFVHGDNPPMPKPTNTPSPQSAGDKKLETITFANGCFWCTEAVFQHLKGVKSVTSGYSGGKVTDPTYEQVCSGTTGHAECLQVTYDPTEIAFTDLLRVFWQTHDPTTLNRQGNDTGTQYRSAIFYHNEEQRKLAEEYKMQLDAEKTFGAPIVTEITPFTNFYPAENYHQDYFEQNPSQGYCQFVIRPKVEKFRKEFGDLLDTAPEAATTKP